MITTTTLSSATERYLMALYYAYGRKDTGDNRVDPIAFAEFYGAQWQQFASGAMSFMPSVQSSWDQYRRSQAA